MMGTKTLAAAALGLAMLTSQASAQCVDCAIYPNRDYLNGGVETPAAKMGLEHAGGGAPVYDPNAAANAHNAYVESQNRAAHRSIHHRKTRAVRKTR